MSVLTKDSLAVPDSAFPFGSNLEGLAGFLDAPTSPDLEGSALDGLKLASLQGDGGYTASYYTQMPYEADCFSGLDADWLCQSTLLPTPQEQDTDVLPPFLPLPMSPYTGQNTFPSQPTPDSSLPSSPESCSYQDPDVLNALSLLDSDADSQLNQSAEVLPQFDVHTPSPLSSPTSYNNPSIAYSSPVSYAFSPNTYEQTPVGACLSSPLSTSLQEFSPETSYPYATAYVDYSLPSSPCDESMGSTSSIRDLLVKTKHEDTPCLDGGDSRKSRIDTATAAGSGGAKGKRRKLSKTAKKERKKEQNKRAALRYRQRKRGEVGDVDDRREELEAINSSLKSQVNSLETEISYLKKLWVEVSEAKGRKSRLQ